MTAKATVEVAVGVVVNNVGQVLVSYRHPDSHQGSLWEFPGGKLEVDETAGQALQRELREELGLQILSSFSCKKIHYQYPDKSVLLHIWRVIQWEGEIRGREGQPFEWRDIKQLKAADFPAANAPIIKLLALPQRIAITPQVESLSELHAVFNHLLLEPVPLIQLRQKQLSRALYLEWFRELQPRCQSHGSTLLFNGLLSDFKSSASQGFHADSTTLMALDRRPVGDALLFSASCHNLAQLQQAEALQADFVFLSPVASTDKYTPDAELGWAGFRRLASQVSLPVYALGGMKSGDMELARAAGAFGISGIRLFLP